MHELSRLVVVVYFWPECALFHFFTFTFAQHFFCDLLLPALSWASVPVVLVDFGLESQRFIFGVKVLLLRWRQLVSFDCELGARVSALGQF